MKVDHNKEYFRLVDEMSVKQLNIESLRIVEYLIGSFPNSWQHKAKHSEKLKYVKQKIDES